MCTENPILIEGARESPRFEGDARGDLDRYLALPFKSKGRLEAENAILRRQVIVLRRQVRGRVKLTNLDRAILVKLYRSFPCILRALVIVRPETVIRWHRAGFGAYWRWKSRRWGGRPQVDAELRMLIRQMSLDNRCGARHVVADYAKDRVTFSGLSLWPKKSWSWRPELDRAESYKLISATRLLHVPV